jgi:hypothetical protein
LVLRGLLLFLVVAPCASGCGDDGGETPGRTQAGDVAAPAAGGGGSTSGAGGAGGATGGGGTAGDSDVTDSQPEAGSEAPATRVFDAGSDPARNQITAGNVCARLAEIQCAGEAFCCDAPGRDVGSCVTTMTAGCRDQLYADMISQKSSTGFDPARAGVVFTELERLASECDPGIASYGESVEGLRGIFRGTVAPDDRCGPPPSLAEVDGAAALASCTSPETHACLPQGLSWRCEPRADVGGDCFTDVNCMPGLFCDNPDLDLGGSTCMQRKAAGSPCALPNECSSLACRGGTCAPAGVQTAYCLQ